MSVFDGFSFWHTCGLWISVLLFYFSTPHLVFPEFLHFGFAFASKIWYKYINCNAVFFRWLVFLKSLLWKLTNALLYDQVEFRILSVFGFILCRGSRIQISVLSICRFLTDLVFGTHADFGFQFCHFILGLRIWCFRCFYILALRHCKIWYKMQLTVMEFFFPWLVPLKSLLWKLTNATFTTKWNIEFCQFFHFVGFWRI